MVAVLVVVAFFSLIWIFVAWRRQTSQAGRLRAIRAPAIISAFCIAVVVSMVSAQPSSPSSVAAITLPSETPSPSPAAVVQPIPSPVTPEPTDTPDQTQIPVIGDEYTLKYAPLCVDDYHVIDAVSTAEEKNDKEGAEQALEGHLVDVSKGTRVRILNNDIFRSDVDVRITSADSDAYGQEIYCLVKTNAGSQPMFGMLLQHE